jgi:hypothetical protein
MRLGLLVAFSLLQTEPVLFAPGVVSTADERPPGDLYRIELDALELPCR